MGSRGTETDLEQPLAGTPEDVAVLYSWANLPKARYRDFSASRREYRAQMRHRAALKLRETELQAQAAALASAEAAEREAQTAEGRLQDPALSQASRTLTQRSAEAATRKAAAKREEAARHGETAAQAASTALLEEREIAEAHASANRQALNYAGLDSWPPQPPDTHASDQTNSSTMAPEPGASPNAVPGESGESAESGGASFFTLDLSREAAALRIARPPIFESSVDAATEPAAALDPEPGSLTISRALSRAMQRASSADTERFRAARTQLEHTGPAWLYQLPVAPQTPASQRPDDDAPTPPPSAEHTNAPWSEP